jgi:hypothetical protein
VLELTANVPLELNTWYVYPPAVDVVPPVALHDSVVMLVEASLSGPVAVVFVPFTLNVNVPAPIPVIVTGLDVPLAVTPPGFAVTVKLEEMPPFWLAVKATVALPIPGVAAPIVGASGTSGICVFPAEADVYFNPANPLLLTFLTDIS